MSSLEIGGHVSEDYLRGLRSDFKAGPGRQSPEFTCITIVNGIPSLQLWGFPGEQRPDGSWTAVELDDIKEYNKTHVVEPAYCLCLYLDATFKEHPLPMNISRAHDSITVGSRWHFACSNPLQHMRCGFYADLEALSLPNAMKSRPPRLLAQYERRSFHKQMFDRTCVLYSWLPPPLGNNTVSSQSPSNADSPTSTVATSSGSSGSTFSSSPTTNIQPTTAGSVNKLVLSLTDEDLKEVITDISTLQDYFDESSMPSSPIEDWSLSAPVSSPTKMSSVSSSVKGEEIRKAKRKHSAADSLVLHAAKRPRQEVVSSSPLPSSPSPTHSAIISDFARAFARPSTGASTSSRASKLEYEYSSHLPKVNMLHIHANSEFYVDVDLLSGQGVTYDTFKALFTQCKTCHNVMLSPAIPSHRCPSRQQARRAKPQLKSDDIIDISEDN